MAFIIIDDIFEWSITSLCLLESVQYKGSVVNAGKIRAREHHCKFQLSNVNLFLVNIYKYIRVGMFYA